MSAKRAAVMVEAIAHGMAAAHAAGIVHRDLKPANVLLASGGRSSASRERERPESNNSGRSRSRLADLIPKVTDFGLAKRVESGDGPTASNAILGTPQYMSPEQASGQGKRVGPAADVYALGAILFRLLTGRPPFEAATQLDVLRKVVSEEPASLRSLNGTVPRDLEVICLKCLSKQPQKRYASADELAKDLKRWLDGKPIEARPVGRTERAAKWVRRNPLVTGLVATVAIALIAGTVISTVFGIQASRARAEAEVQEERAEGNFAAAKEAVEQYLVKVTGNEKLKQAGFRDLRADLLKSAEPFYERLRDQRPGDAAVESSRADAFFRLALIQQDLGELRRAVEDYRECVAVYRRLAEAHPGVPAYRVALGGGYCNSGNLSRSRDQAAALQWYAKAEKELRGVLDDEPRHATARLFLANTLMGRAGVRERLARYAEAAEDWDKAAELDDGRRKAVLQQLAAKSRAMAEQAEQFERILAGEAEPADVEDRVALAKHCSNPSKQLYRTAAQHYKAAFAEQPGLVADPTQTSHRYDAACCAARAAAGEGDATDPTPQQRTQWREQALAWLQADLELRLAGAQSDDPEVSGPAKTALNSWRSDPDLATVRDDIDGLPESERQQWQQLWAEVDTLLKATDTMEQRSQGKE